ncbi:MAG: hypothetical protein AAB726_03115 [Patescibacteria group bacterium]
MKADIFFFITSAAVIIFTIGIIVVVFYVVRILRDMRHISKTMSQETDKVATIVNLFLDRFLRRKGRSAKIKKEE